MVSSWLSSAIKLPPMIFPQVQSNCIMIRHRLIALVLLFCKYTHFKDRYLGVLNTDSYFHHGHVIIFLHYCLHLISYMSLVDWNDWHRQPQARKSYYHIMLTVTVVGQYFNSSLTWNWPLATGNNTAITSSAASITMKFSCFASFGKEYQSFWDLCTTLKINA